MGALAILKNNISFDQITETIRLASGKAILYKETPTSSAMQARIEYRNNDAWGLPYADAHVYRYDDSVRFMPQEIAEWSEWQGFTVVSIYDVWIARAIAERFGGWLKSDEYSEKCERIQKKELNMSETIKDDVEAWKAAGAKLVGTIEEYIRAMEDISPYVKQVAGEHVEWKVNEGISEDFALASSVLDAEVKRLGSLKE